MIIAPLIEAIEAINAQAFAKAERKVAMRLRASKRAPEYRRCMLQAAFNRVIFFEVCDPTCIKVFPHGLSTRDVLMRARPKGSLNPPSNGTIHVRKEAQDSPYVIEQWVVTRSGDFRFRVADVEAPTLEEAVRAIYLAFQTRDPEFVELMHALTHEADFAGMLARTFIWHSDFTAQKGFTLKSRLHGSRFSVFFDAYGRELSVDLLSGAWKHVMKHFGISEPSAGDHAGRCRFSDLRFQFDSVIRWYK